MLIYNHKKEFIGIDQTYLDIFNLSSLSELKTLVSDFADFFISSPGYVHNFVHIHWIDYILCDDSSISPKVLIDINDNSYSANLDIKIIYLTDDPDQKAYSINLLNIISLTSTGEEKISCEVEKPVEPFFDQQTINYDDKKIEIDLEPAILEPSVVIQDTYEEPVINIKVNEDLPQIGNFDTYVYDPEIASTELGLPIDLVEEFIQDFIAQAQSFKSEILTCISNSDLERTKVLSHILKGVAANLRIQDALEILKNISATEEIDSTRRNIEKFYKIIDKLSLAHTQDDFVLNVKD